VTKRAIKVDQFFFRLALFHLLKPEIASTYIKQLKEILDGYAEELKSEIKAIS